MYVCEAKRTFRRFVTVTTILENFPNPLETKAEYSFPFLGGGGGGEGSCRSCG
jgi:hypothetical protein